MSTSAQLDSDSPPFPLLPTALKLQHTKVEEHVTERDPTEKELCECIMMVKDRFPQCRLDKVILMLYELLVREEGEYREAKRRGEDKRRGFVEDEYLSEEEMSEMEKKKMQQEYSRKFENSEANPRFYEQRQIAKLFCSKGYGYPTARQYLGDSITPNRYNNVITTIVRLSYRKLEYFIIKYVQPRLALISREELKMIKTPLVNCRNWMTEQQADNFHRFVKMTYKINTEEPEKDVVLELHQAIMQQLRKRNVTYRPHRRGGDPNAWSPEMDGHLISNYLAHQNPSEIQKQLSVVFPTHRSCFELGRLRLRLERLLRLALRKVYADRDKFGLNEPVTMSEYLVAKISRAVGAVDVRKRLLSYYLDGDTNAMKLRWVREVLEEYVKISRLEVEEIEDSSCELLAKEELKAETGLEHNHEKEQESYQSIIDGEKKKEEE